MNYKFKKFTIKQLLLELIEGRTLEEITAIYDLDNVIVRRILLELIEKHKDETFWA